MTALLEPAGREELAEALREAGAAGRRLRVRGAGTRGRRGGVVPEPDATISTLRLDRVVDHHPADLTVTVEAGMRVADLAALLAEAGQRWPQADAAAGGTVGGAIAAGASGRRRLRHGPVRDGLLEMVVVTGDGRMGKAGGRTVKGVAGYDLPRLMTGALGTLGVIVQVTLKLWPMPPAEGWFVAEGDVAERIAAAERWRDELVRPGAILLRPDGAWACLEGAPDDVRPPSGARPAAPPPVPDWPGTIQAGVPPPRVGDLVAALAAQGREHEAQVGVGACTVSGERAEDVAAVRALASGLGGHAWVADGPEAMRADPWGPDPGGIDVMRRLKAAFDPAGVLDPGTFAGRI